MKTPSISTPTLSFIIILALTISCSWADDRDDFLECLSTQFHNSSSIWNHVYTTNNSSYTSVLQSSIRNLRFASGSTPTPQVIITPEHESQIPPLIHCARESDLEIRTRSGGHDVEGLSFVSQVPFVIIDLINLSEITVDAVEKTAWAGAGATIGSLYYRIAEKSRVLGFPAGVCPTVGLGGHLSGGGYGPMLRKYGLAADNVIDARIVDAGGRVLDREAMGEDLFWAIRGGGGASFGVIVAWKVRLVDVPETVTIFSVGRAWEQNGTQLVHRWQSVAPSLDRDLFIGVFLNSSEATFWSVFLGGADRLFTILQQGFPELGVVREDCVEMSWIESNLYLSEAPVIPPSRRSPLESLLSRTPVSQGSSKVKSDYVQKPIPESGLRGIQRLFDEPQIQPIVLMVPYGGRMGEISESATPFPHRGGNLYKIASTVFWQGEQESEERYINWSRRYYSYMARYVSRSPRRAYLNYRDLDIGVNSVEGDTTYAQASIWGRKYFNNNFDRLVRIKTVVDPHNFFRNEQSVPPLHSHQ